MNSIVESFGPTAATIGGGFFIGILIRYALKKVIKLVAVIVGLFLAGLADVLSLSRFSYDYISIIFVDLFKLYFEII